MDTGIPLIFICKLLKYESYLRCKLNLNIHQHIVHIGGSLQLCVGYTQFKCNSLLGCQYLNSPVKSPCHNTFQSRPQFAVVTIYFRHILTTKVIKKKKNYHTTVCVSMIILQFKVSPIRTDVVHILTTKVIKKIKLSYQVVCH